MTTNDSESPRPADQAELDRGRVPIEGTTDGDNGLYLEATRAERREAIRWIGDAAQAVYQAMGTLHALKALGEILVQDTVRDHHDWVLGIGNSIIEQGWRDARLLDRAGGWPSGYKA